MAMIQPAKPSNLENFFGQLLPADGNCWMLMLKRGEYFDHESFDTVEAITDRVNALEAEGVEVYHAVASFIHRHDANKDGSTDRWGRKAENVAFVSAFFLDVDVAEDKPGNAYATIEEAEDGLSRFVEAFGMPYNYLVRSGSGFHVYWFLDVDVPRDEWRRIALKFKDATKSAGLLADPVRTADPASVLRPVGTTNRKTKYGPAGRPVAGKWCRFGKVNLGEFEATCDRLLSSQLAAGRTPIPNASSSTKTDVEPTQPPRWFDDLADDVRMRVLRSMLAKLNTRSVSDYSDWISVGAALAGVEGLPRDDLFDLWAEWSQSTDEGASSWCEDSPEEQRRRFDGLTRSGVGALIVRAKEAGWVNPLLDAQLGKVRTVTGVVEDRYPTVDAARAAIAKNFAYARLDDKFVSRDGAVLSAEAFERYVARYMPLDSNGKPMSAVYIATKLGAASNVEVAGYAPGRDFIYEDHGTHQLMANKYQPQIVDELEPTELELKALVFFKKHLASDDAGTEEMIRYFDQALAYLVQHPTERIPKVFLMIGETQGSGKSTYTLGFTRALFGSRNVGKATNSEIKSNFNDWMTGYQIVCLEEIWMADRKDSRDLVNSLKDNITDGIARIHPKGGKGFQMTNPATYFASSNHLDAVDLADGDRRWAIAHTKAGALDLRFADWLHRWLQPDGRGPGVLRYIYSRMSLEGFDPYGSTPRSQAKVDVVELSHTDIERIVFDAWAESTGPFKTDLTTLEDVCQFVSTKLGNNASRKQVQLALQSTRVNAKQTRAKKERNGMTAVKRLWITGNHAAYGQLGPAQLYDAYERSIGVATLALSVSDASHADQLGSDRVA